MNRAEVIDRGTQSEPQITNGYDLLDLARGWLKQGNPVVAIELLKSAADSTEAQRDPALFAQILKETGRTAMLQADWKTAETCYLRAQMEFLRLEDFRGAAESARNRANMAFQQGSYQSAEQLCEQALEWASELGDHELRATILNTLGAVKSARGEQREAVGTFEQCLTEFQRSGNRIRQGYVLLNIGLSRTELGECAAATTSLQEALRIAFCERDLNLVEICYQNIARCHLAQNDARAARAVSETARSILPGLNSRALEVELNVLDARILTLLGDIDAAEEVLENSLHLTIDHNLAQLHADILFEQGKLCRIKGESSLALYKLDSAAYQYRKIGAEQGFRRAVQELENLKKAQRT